MLMPLLFVGCDSTKTNKKITLVIPVAHQSDALLAVIKTLENSLQINLGEFGSSWYKSTFTLNKRRWVKDYDSIFSLEEAAILNNKITNFEKKTSIEIVLVSIPGYWSNTTYFDEFVTNTGRQWGVGKKEKNNGIIIGISKELKN